MLCFCPVINVKNRSAPDVFSNDCGAGSFFCTEEGFD